MKTQLSGGLEPTIIPKLRDARAKDARPSNGAASLWQGGLLLIAFVHFTGVCSAQVNLVPNPSFEENVGCPNTSAEIGLAIPWEKVGGDGVITYYHECCDVVGCGVPMNRYGAAYANSGQSYADVSLVHPNHVLSFHAESNFLGTPLVNPLNEAKRYKVEFYLNLYDSARFAGRNIGIYFSIGKPSENINDLLDIVPQFKYHGDFLTDKDGWMKIEGSFVAEGGENYLTIGNFDGYFNSDTLHLNEGGIFPNIGYWEVAHYFIDDVSVFEDRSIGMEETENDIFRFYPNPAYDAVTVEVEQGKAVVFFDVSGREIFQSLLHSSKEAINIGHLPRGLYTVNVTMQDGSVLRQRLVKQ